MRNTILILMVATLVVAMAGCSNDEPIAPVSADGETEEADFESSTHSEKSADDGDEGVPASVRAYEIIVENLTPATGDGASQPFSPPILATHARAAGIFRPGTYASDELAQVAEDAVGGPLIDQLDASSRVFEVTAGDGVILPGGDARFEIRSNGGQKYLSMVFMLVNTNDAFGGLNHATLPRWGERVYMVRAFDAGSELNTELATDIPGPCCGSPGMGTDEHKRVRHHMGIMGGADLDPETYGWNGPVARVTIRRLVPVYEVTLENLAPETVAGGSQVFSPPLLATHRCAVGMFRVGRHATDAMAALAEGGDRSGLVEMLGDSPKVRSLVEADGALPPGAMATWEVEALSPYERLSVATMLVNTNDGFTGADRLRLPSGGSRSWMLRTWDAGSEVNTELMAHIPGPCCGSPGMGEDEENRIHHHRGILGTGDLDADDYGWEDPVARLTVTRIR